MIELHGVSRTVPSGDQMLTILHPLDLRIESGRVAAITGPSGSGKSTLLGLIAGLDAPSSGHLVIDGSDITAMSEDALARFRGTRIGFVFQFFHLLPSLTAWENVRVPLEIAGSAGAGRRADELLAEVGLAARRHHYPSQLSGGEQQRVAIARALANDPPILLADEPTGNLDSTTGRQVIDLLIDVNRRRGTTVVLVTHNVLEAETVLDRVAVVDRGRIIACDTPGRLKAAVDDSVRVVLVWHHEPPYDDSMVETLARSAVVDGRRWSVRLERSRVREVLDRLTQAPLFDALEDYTVSTPSLEDVYLSLGGTRVDMDKL
jgi:putative ABC transport system ATP-binding protein